MYIHQISVFIENKPGNIANFTKKLKVGDHIQLYGRTQSRIYVKDGELKKANEISIFQLQKVEE